MLAHLKSFTFIGKLPIKNQLLVRWKSFETFLVGPMKLLNFKLVQRKKLILILMLVTTNISLTLLTMHLLISKI